MSSMVATTGKIRIYCLRLYAPENLVSRNRFGLPVPRVSRPFSHTTPHHTLYACLPHQISTHITPAATVLCLFVLVFCFISVLLSGFCTRIKIKNKTVEMSVSTACCGYVALTSNMCRSPPSHGTREKSRE